MFAPAAPAVEIAWPTTGRRSYQIVESPEGWYVMDPLGAVIDRASSFERALAIVDTLAAATDAAVEPFAC